MARDVRDVMQQPPHGISACPQRSDVLDVLDAQLLGPDDTPYAGGVFDLVVTFPSRWTYNHHESTSIGRERIDSGKG